MAYLRYEKGHGVYKTPIGQYRLLADGSIVDQGNEGRVVSYLMPLYSADEIDSIFKMRPAHKKQRILRNHVSDPERRQEIIPKALIETVPESYAVGFREIPMHNSPGRMELKQAIMKLV